MLVLPYNHYITHCLLFIKLYFDIVPYVTYISYNVTKIRAIKWETCSLWRTGENINFMNNMKRKGLVVKNPNLCLEIIETHEEGEVASCNLANINIPKFWKKKVFIK